MSANSCLNCLYLASWGGGGKMCGYEPKLPAHGRYHPQPTLDIENPYTDCEAWRKDPDAPEPGSSQEGQP